MMLTMSDVVDYAGPSYVEYLKAGQRKGQAFFNALSPGDQERLRGSVLDPFYRDSNEPVLDALAFLLGA